MMYLIEPNSFNILKKQYFFKLKTNFGLIFNLILFQIFAIFLSLVVKMTSSSFGMDELTFYVSSFSGNIVIGFTLIWACTVPAILTNSKIRNIDFTFVSNRFTSNISNIGLLITLSLFGSVTACLSSNLIRVLFYFISNPKSIVNEGFFVSPQYILISIISTTLYIILVMSILYFLGLLKQLTKVFIILFFAIAVAIILGFKLFSSTINFTLIDLINKVFNFYKGESSLVVFAVKVLLTALVFFSGATLISSKLEVRR
jgi:hypothetical protein